MTRVRKKASLGDLSGFGLISDQQTLGIKTAQKPYIVWSLGPKALIYESLES